MSPSRVRVLYLQPAPLFGGAERQAASLVSLLPAHGFDVLPMTGPGRVVVDWLRARGVSRVVLSPCFPGGWPRQRGLGLLTLPWRYLRSGLRARAEIEQLIEAHHIELIVASLPFSWITGSLAARRRGLPVVWRAGGSRIDLLQKAALFCLTRFLRPALLLCNAESVRRTFAPLVPAPVAVVLNGVDANVFHPRAGHAARYRPPGARLVVGCAGRMTRAKQPHAFVRMAARLKQRYPDVCFLLGGDGLRRAELEALAAKLGADNLTFLGFVSDMPSFYAACDVVVLPSRAEGCPNFILEAMAMAKPIVAARVDPVLELVEPGGAALLYPYGDLQALTEAVARLLDEPESRAAFALRAQARAQRFAASENAERLAALLAQVVAVPAPAPASLAASLPVGPGAPRSERVELRSGPPP